MIIIFGTAFPIPRIKLSVKSYCRICEKLTIKHSFVGYKYFTLFYLPAIPIAKYIARDYCSGCAQVKLSPFREWKGNRASTLENINRKIETMNVDEVLDIYREMVILKEEEIKAKIETMFEGKFSQNREDVIKIASWYEIHFMYTMAEKYYALLIRNHENGRDIILHTLRQIPLYLSNLFIAIVVEMIDKEYSGDKEIIEAFCFYCLVNRKQSQYSRYFETLSSLDRDNIFILIFRILESDIKEDLIAYYKLIIDNQLYKYYFLKKDIEETAIELFIEKKGKEAFLLINGINTFFPSNFTNYYKCKKILDYGRLKKYI